MIYNITNPFSVSFVDYVVNRDFDTDFEIDSDTGEVEDDISTNGSPTLQPLLVIGNEVSGTTSMYALSF